MCVTTSSIFNNITTIKDCNVVNLISTQNITSNSLHNTYNSIFTHDFNFTTFLEKKV